MRPVLTFVFATFFAATSLAAQEPVLEASEGIWDSLVASDSDNLTDFLWTKRPIVVFADTPNDPRFEQQMSLLQERAADLVERDVVVLADTDPESKSALRTKLRPRGFMMVVIGKDGGVKLRKASPWDVREITRVIDKTPSRQREVRDLRQP